MLRILTAGLCLSLALLLPSVSQGQGRNKNTISTLETTPQDYEALKKMPGIAARLLSVEPGAVTVRVEYQVAQMNPNAAKVQPPRLNPNQFRNNNNRNRNFNRNNNRNNRNQNPQQRAMQQYQQMMQQQMRMQQQMQQQMQRYYQQLAQAAQQQAKNMKVETLAKVFRLPMSAEVRVARKDLGLEYDEKGNLKKYTEAEKAKLHDEKLPGYKAGLEHLQPGQMVYVYLGQAAAQPGGKAPAGQGEKKEEKQDPFAELLGGAPAGATLGAGGPAAGPTVNAILILTPADTSVLPQQPGKKKN